MFKPFFEELIFLSLGAVLSTAAVGIHFAFRGQRFSFLVSKLRSLRDLQLLLFPQESSCMPTAKNSMTRKTSNFLRVFHKGFSWMSLDISR